MLIMVNSDMTSMSSAIDITHEWILESLGFTYYFHDRARWADILVRDKTCSIKKIFIVKNWFKFCHRSRVPYISNAFVLRTYIPLSAVLPYRLLSRVAQHLLTFVGDLPPKKVTVELRPLIVDLLIGDIKYNAK